MNILDKIQHFLQNLHSKHQDEPRARVSIRREELADITGHWLRSEILNYFLFHTLCGNEWVEGGGGTLANALMLYKSPGTTVDPRTLRKHTNVLVAEGFLEPKAPGLKDLYRGYRFRVNLDFVIEKIQAAGFHFSQESHSTNMPHAQAKNVCTPPKEASNPVTAHGTKMHHAYDKNDACTVQKRTMHDTKMMHDQDQRDLIKDHQDQIEADVDSLQANEIEDGAHAPERFSPELALKSLGISIPQPDVDAPPVAPAPPEPVTAQAIEQDLRQDAARQLLMSVGLLMNKRTRAIVNTVPLEIIKAHVDIYESYYKQVAQSNPEGYLLKAIENRELPKKVMAQKQSEQKQAQKSDLSEKLAEFLSQAQQGAQIMLESGKQLIIKRVFGTTLESTLEVTDQDGTVGRMSIHQALSRGVVFV